jgi:hypothetical protein
MRLLYLIEIGLMLAEGPQLVFEIVLCGFGQCPLQASYALLTQLVAPSQ